MPGWIGLASDQPGEPEVEDPQTALLVDDDIRRFQVAMDDSLLVGVGDGAAYLEKQIETFLARHVVFLDIRVQRDAIDQLHREVVESLLGAARLVDRGDSGMLQLGQRFALAPEVLDELVARKTPSLEHLQRHETVRIRLLGLVDERLATLAEKPLDRVGADPVGDDDRGAGGDDPDLSADELGLLPAVGAGGEMLVQFRSIPIDPTPELFP
jgi:hypothetical protein